MTGYKNLVISPENCVVLSNGRNPIKVLRNISDGVVVLKSSSLRVFERCWEVSITSASLTRGKIRRIPDFDPDDRRLSIRLEAR